MSLARNKKAIVKSGAALLIAILFFCIACFGSTVKANAVEYGGTIISYAGTAEETVTPMGVDFLWYYFDDLIKGKSPVIVKAKTISCFTESSDNSYEMDGDDDLDITIENYGDGFDTGGVLATKVVFKNSKRVKLKNLRIVGNIVIKNTETVALENVTIVGDLTIENADSVSLDNVTLEKNESQNETFEGDISISGAESVSFRNNVANNVVIGYAMGSNTDTIVYANNTVNDLDIVNVKKIAFDNTVGTINGTLFINNKELYDNEIANEISVSGVTTGGGLNVDGAKPTVIKNCTVNGTTPKSSFAVKVYRSRDATLEGITTKNAGVDINSSKVALMKDCNITAKDQYDSILMGMDVWNSTVEKITNCTFDAYAGRRYNTGIHLDTLGKINYIENTRVYGDRWAIGVDSGFAQVGVIDSCILVAKENNAIYMYNGETQALSMNGKVDTIQGNTILYSENQNAIQGKIPPYCDPKLSAAVGKVRIYDKKSDHSYGNDLSCPAGYTWRTGGGGQCGKVADVEGAPYKFSDKDFYYLSRDNCTITYDKGAGTSGYMSPFTVHGGEVAALQGCRYFCDNCTFTYYTDNIEGTGEHYLDKPYEFTGDVTDLTLYAQWKTNSGSTNKYKVQFDTGEGSKIGDCYVMEGNKVYRPEEVPTWTGGTFAGWYDSASCDHEYDFDTPVTADKTIYAKWDLRDIKIKYHSNGGPDPSLSETTVKYGQVLTAEQIPAEMQKLDYTFDGWYTEPSGGNWISLSRPVRTDGDELDYYAHWSRKKVRVTYVMEPGAFYNNVRSGVNKGADGNYYEDLPSGEKASDPVEPGVSNAGPIRSGHTFTPGDFYADQEYTTKFDFDQAIREPVNVYIRMTPKKYLVKYFDEVSVHANKYDYTEEIEWGKYPTWILPRELWKENAVFTGWYDVRGNKYYDAETEKWLIAVDYNIGMCAGWEYHEHTWTYSQSGNEIKAWCVSEDAAKEVCAHHGESNAAVLRLTAANAYCTGKPYNGASLSNEISELTGEEVSAISYKGTGDTQYASSTTPPTLAGTYECSVTLGDHRAVQAFNIDHDWIYEYKWSDDNSSVTATRHCGCEGCDASETETANSSSEETKAPKCTEKGELTYTATFTNTAFPDQIKTVETDAAGHQWSWEEITDDTGHYYYCKCENCDSTQRLDIDPKDCDHAYNTIARKEATCTEDGHEEYYQCSKCKTYFVKDNGSYVPVDKYNLEEYLGKLVIPATGHEWAFDNFMWAGDDETGYTGARAVFHCKHDRSHTESVEVGLSITETPATCEKDGQSIYNATLSADASLDEKAHSDERAVEIPKTGHEWVFTGFSWTGNDTKGYTAARAEYRCSHDASHRTSTEASLSGKTIEPTCTQTGYTRYTATVEAGSSKDGNAHSENKSAATTNALGHNWAVEYEWNKDNSKVTATRYCEHQGCEEKETETAETTSEVIKMPTCTERGETLYTATFNSESFVTQSKSVTDIAETGHKWGDPEWVEKTDDTGHYNERKCGQCGLIQRTDIPPEDCDHEYSIVSPRKPTCTQEGNEEYYKCRKCKCYFVKNGDSFILVTKENIDDYMSVLVIPALGHEWEEPVYKWTADYSKVTAERVCKRDPSHKETETVGTSVTREIKPTVEANGLKVYTSDSFINPHFNIQTREVTVSNDEVKKKAAAMAVGAEHVIGGGRYRVTSTNGRTVSLVKAPNKKSFTIPATVGIDGKTFNVTGLQSDAFRGTKCKTLTVKTKGLTKASVKGSLKGSKVKTVKVKVGKKKENKKYVKKYKRYFTKKNCGKKVRVRR